MNIKNMKEVYEYLAKYSLTLTTWFDGYNRQYKVYLEGKINGQEWRSILGFAEDEVEVLCKNQLQICEKLIYQHQKEINKVGVNTMADTAKINHMMNAVGYSMEAFKQMGDASKFTGMTMKEAATALEVPANKLEKTEPVYVNI